MLGPWDIARRLRLLTPRNFGCIARRDRGHWLAGLLGIWILLKAPQKWPCMAAGHVFCGCNKAEKWKRTVLKFQNYPVQQLLKSVMPRTWPVPTYSCCPRSSVPFYIVTYYIKCVTTSGTDGSRGETKADAEIIMSIVDWSKQLSICWKAFHNSTGQEPDYSDIRLN